MHCVPKLLVLAGLLAVFLPACAGTRLRHEISQLHNQTRERTGYDVQWNGYTTNDEQIAAATLELLAQPLDADRAVRSALLNNRRLQAEYTRLGIATADFVAAMLPPNPNLSGAYQWSVNGGNVHKWTADVGIDLLQTLLIPLRRKAAGAELDATRNELTGQIVALISDTRRAFYQYQAQEQLQVLWQTVQQATDAARDFAERLHAAGNITRVDLLREQALDNEAKLAVSENIKELARARETLNVKMGLWGNATAWRAVDRLPELPASVSVNDLETTAVARSFDLAASRSKLIATARAAGIRNVESWLPHLEAGAALERESETEYELKNKSDGPELKEKKSHARWAGPSLSLSLPIFDWGHTARLKSKMAVQRAADEYAAEAVELRAAAREVGSRLLAAHQQARLTQDTLVPLRHATTEEMQLRYNAMFEGPMQLLQAKRDEIDAGRRYVETLRDFWLARTDADELIMGRKPDEASNFGSQIQMRMQSAGFSHQGAAH